MLTEKQVEAYKRDGYLRVKELFTPEEVKALKLRNEPNYRRLVG